MERTHPGDALLSQEVENPNPPLEVKLGIESDPELFFAIFRLEYRVHVLYEVVLVENFQRSFIRTQTQRLFVSDHGLNKQARNCFRCILCNLTFSTWPRNLYWIYYLCRAESKASEWIHTIVMSSLWKLATQLQRCNGSNPKFSRKQHISAQKKRFEVQIPRRSLASKLIGGRTARPSERCHNDKNKTGTMWSLYSFNTLVNLEQSASRQDVDFL